MRVNALFVISTLDSHEHVRVMMHFHAKRGGVVVERVVALENSDRYQFQFGTRGRFVIFFFLTVCQSPQTMLSFAMG